MLTFRSFASHMLFALVCVFLSQWVHAQGEANRGAFPAVRWIPEVSIDGRWYQLHAIDDVPVQDIIAFIVHQDDDRWTRRFAEDLVEMLTKMGNPPGETIKVVVRDLETGQERTLEKVPLTRANRDAIKKFRREFESRPFFPRKPESLKSGLDTFKAAMDERWSYRHTTPADFDSAIAALRAKIDAGISINDFGIELQKIIALGIDGHAGVSGFDMPRGGYLPFLMEIQGERTVAFKPDRTGFLADGFPYLTRIDGRNIADWCTAAAVLKPKGSPQYIRLHALNNLRYVDYLRGQMQLPIRNVVEIELAAADGKTLKTLTLPVARAFSLNDVWPRGGSRVLDGQIGYLRLPSMDASTSVPEIRNQMARFRDTQGLIVDVRDNGGGDRDALLLLYSYLAAPNDPPRVFTAAAYRLHNAHGEEHLAARFMYRADATEWTAEERQAINEFARTFKPEWELPKGQFSDWHYMVLRRLDDATVYHYAKPVVVLMNARCFSATDVFLAGLKGMKNVTLLGTPSAGGSAFVQDVPLGATPFGLRIGSMASFQSNGKLFDGNGVAPDVIVEPAPDHHIGGRDNALEEAAKRIRTK